MMVSVSPSMIQSLAAVRVAVGDALSAAAQALATGGDEATLNAQREWRSAHAAMQIVNHPALLQFSTELGALIAAAGVEPSAQAAAFRAGADALTAFVDALSTGGRAHAMRLWPAYEAMQRARGVAEPHQSELFFPNVNLHPDDRPEATALSADALRGARRVLEAGLLQWLRKGDIAGIKQIAAAVRRIEGAQRSGSARRLWWIACGVLEAVQQGGLSADLQVRRLLTQLNLQLGRLVQGAPDAPEALLRDALYLAARAQPQAGMQVLHGVRQLYSLNGALDIAAGDEAAVGVISVEAIAAARRAAAGLQDLWSACAAGSGALADFEQRARALAGACEALAQPALTALVVQLAEHAHALAQPGQNFSALSEVAALEGACALLMIENALADHTPAAPFAADHTLSAGFAESYTLSAGFAGNFTLSADFAARAHNMAARLKLSVQAPQALSDLPPAQLLDEAAQQVQATAQRALVHAEITRNFGDIERTLGAWFLEPDNSQKLTALDKPLRQAGGVLSVLGHTAAAALTAQCRIDVARYADGAPCDETERRALTGRLAALSAFVVAAQQGPAQLADGLMRVTPALAPAAAPAEGLLEVGVDTAGETPGVTPGEASAESPLDFTVEAIAPAEDFNLEMLAAQAPVTDVPVDSAQDTDLEMLEIFLEEAGEVLTTITQTAPQSCAAPQDQELLTVLRRAFHTLKGSGRMVGLKNMAEAAWEMEQVFNEMSAGQRPGVPDLYRLIDFAHSCFTRWLLALRAHRQVPVDSMPLIELTTKFRAGAALPLVLAGALESTPVPLAGQPIEAVSDNVQVGAVSISRTLYEIVVPEARDHVQVLEREARAVAAGAKVTHEFVRAAHTLRGIAGTTGFSAIGALGASLERVLQSTLDLELMPQPEACAWITRAVSALSAQVASLAALQAPVEYADLVAGLDAMNVAPAPVKAAQDAMPALPPVPAAPLQAVEQAPAVSPQAADTMAPPPAPAQDNAGARQPKPEDGGMERREYRLLDDLDPQLLPIFMEEATELVPQVGQELRDWRARPDDKRVPQSLKRLLHTLKGSARMAGAMALGQLTHSMESRIDNAQLLPSIPVHLLDDLETSFRAYPVSAQAYYL